MHHFTFLKYEIFETYGPGVSDESLWAYSFSSKEKSAYLFKIECEHVGYEDMA